MSEAKRAPLRVGFDRKLKLEFHGAKIASDAGSLLHRELGEAMCLTAMTRKTLDAPRTGANVLHSTAALLSRSVFGRLAGYENTNDAERFSISHAPQARGKESRLLRIRNSDNWG